LKLLNDPAGRAEPLFASVVLISPLPAPQRTVRDPIYGGVFPGLWTPVSRHGHLLLTVGMSIK
jgi:hypothetical protein